MTPQLPPLYSACLLHLLPLNEKRASWHGREKNHTGLGEKKSVRTGSTKGYSVLFPLNQLSIQNSVTDTNPLFLNALKPCAPRGPVHRNRQHRRRKKKINEYLIIYPPFYNTLGAFSWCMAFTRFRIQQEFQNAMSGTKPYRHIANSSGTSYDVGLKFILS